MTRKILTTIMASGCVLSLTAVGAQSVTSAAGARQPGERPDRQDAPTETWIEFVGGVEIEVTGTTGPRFEPAVGYSQQRRAGERERADLRERLGWGSLSDDMKAALWPIAVGRDNIDERGILQVSLAWSYTPTYRGADNRGLDMDINVDGDAVIVGQNQGTDSADPEFSEILMIEIDGAANASDGWTENWERSFKFGGSGVERFVGARRGAVDLSGNSYACGRRNNDQYAVTKRDGADGTSMWLKSFDAPNGGTNAIAEDIVVDAEGLVYVAGYYDDAVTKLDRWFVARHRPNNGNRDWIVDLGDGRPVGGIEIDRRGDLLLAGEREQDHVCMKISPYDGTPYWVSTVPTAEEEFLAEFTDSLGLDADGNPVFAGAVDTETGDNGWQITKWDGETGVQLWSTTEAQGKPQDLEVDDNGDVYVCGNSGTNTFVLRKYDSSSGAWLWTYSGGTTGRAEDLVLDRLGNPYMTGQYGTAFIQTSKHDPDDGSVVWLVDGESPTRNNEVNTDLEVRDIVIDGGGNLYVCGFREGSSGGGGFSGKEIFVVKYEQPYLAIPQITRSYPQLSMSGVSVWDPVPNDDGPDYTDPSTILAYNQEWDLFSFDVPGSIENIIEGPARRTIDYGIGEVSGGVDVQNFSGGVDVSLVAESSAGTFDASVTGELAIAIPGEDELFATQDFDIVVNWDPDSMGIQLISDAEPTLTAGIKAKTRGNMDLRFQFSDTYLGNVSQGIDDINLSYNPDDPIIGIGPGSLPEAGIWVELAEFPFDQYYSGQVRSPLLKTEGSFNAGTNTISSSIRQKVLSGKIRATNLILAYFGATPPVLSVNAGAGAGGNGWEAEFEAGLLQADLDTKLYVLQDLDVGLRPYVNLEYLASDDTVLGSDRLNFYSGSGNPVQQRTATVTLPADGEMEIRPSFGADVVFTNSSGVEVVVTRSFKPANLEAKVALADTDLINVEKCFECIERDNSYEFRPYDITKNISFPSEDDLAPIQVFGNVDLQPQLIGLSLETARMIIYDQSSPTVAEFEDAVSGTIPVVLYGYNFFSGTNITVRMKHQGRNEVLDRTRLNNQALLVQIPKRMLLVPGAARLLVINDNGRSETIDLVIEHPFPNFQGILENYWASDPRWQEDAVKFIDGGTPAGNDSFIVRRDYYTYLADNLWSSAILQDLGNPNQEAWEYFDDFAGWERPEDPKSAPGIPTILVNGVTIPRDPSNPSNGRLRAEFPESVVATPDFIDVQICSPGPGGGMSRTFTYELPAPRPVISRIEPELVRPGDVDGDFVRIAVEGPASVPFFAGYEGEKYGNFTPLSVVWIDKTPLETEFISSSELTAKASASLFDTGGTRLVRVVTPNPNGTEYFDFQIAGDGTPVFSGMVPSGGNSVSVPLRVGWPEPFIDYVSHTVVEQGLPPVVPVTVDGMLPEDNHNITIFGDNFAPGCRVYINGRLASSTRDAESHGMVRATLLASDVSRLGFVRVYVENPAPDLRGSNTFLIEVIPAAP